MTDIEADIALVRHDSANSETKWARAADRLADEIERLRKRSCFECNKRGSLVCAVCVKRLRGEARAEELEAILRIDPIKGTDKPDTTDYHRGWADAVCEFKQVIIRARCVR